ncbi:MAG: hypothetical protein KKA84_09255 [Bacteroidetes bacterium]|nr:hypothetical protein [Bacteroidota bacterium]
MVKRKVQLAAIIFLAMTTLMFGHEDHKKNVAPDTLTIVNGDTIAVNGIPRHLSDKDSIDISNYSEIESEPYEISFPEILFEHIHNKLVHFPIALIYAAIFFTLLGIRKNDFIKTIKILLILTMISISMVVLSGLNQTDPFLGNSKEWIVNIHRNVGIITTVFTGFWLGSLFIKLSKWHVLVIGIITVLLISSAAFMGGILSH